MSSGTVKQDVEAEACNYVILLSNWIQRAAELFQNKMRSFKASVASGSFILTNRKKVNLCQFFNKTKVPSAFPKDGRA